MKLHKLLVLATLSLSLNCNERLFAGQAKAKTDSETQDKAKSSVPFSHTAEKMLAVSQLVGACADTWASENQEISKNTRNLIIGLASAARLASNITTQVININEDSSRMSLAHAPWIIIDASQLMNIVLNTNNNEESTLQTQFEGLLTENSVEQSISTEDYSSLKMISRHFTAIGEGASVIAASFLRDRTESISIFGKTMSPQVAREMCYTLSSIMRSGNILLASKPSLPKAIFAVSLVAYSALLIYQFSYFNSTTVTPAEFEAACKRLGLNPKNLDDESNFDQLIERLVRDFGINANQTEIDAFLQERKSEALRRGLITNSRLAAEKDINDLISFAREAAKKAEDEGLATPNSLSKLFTKEKVEKMTGILKKFSYTRKMQPDQGLVLVKDFLDIIDFKKNKNFKDIETVIRGLKPEHFPTDQKLIDNMPFASFDEFIYAAVLAAS